MDKEVKKAMTMDIGACKDHIHSIDEEIKRLQERKKKFQESIRKIRNHYSKR